MIKQGEKYPQTANLLIHQIDLKVPFAGIETPTVALEEKWFRLKQDHWHLRRLSMDGDDQYQDEIIRQEAQLDKLVLQMIIVSLGCCTLCVDPMIYYNHLGCMYGRKESKGPGPMLSAA
jgi:hypothetical protein